MNNDNEKILDLYKVQPKVLVSYKLTVADEVLPVVEKKEKKIQTVFMDDNFFKQVKKEDDFIDLRSEKYRFISSPDAKIKLIVSNHFCDFYNQKEHGYASTNFDIYDIKKHNDLSIVLVQIRKSKLDKDISNNKKKTTLYFLIAIENNNVILQKRIKYFSGLFIHNFILSKTSPIHMIFKKDEENIINFKPIIEGV